MSLIEFNTVTLQVEEAVATITLNRPDRMNAFTGEMAQELIACLDFTDADDRVRAVIVTGSGSRAFCAGADLSAGADSFDYDAQGAQDAKVGDVYRDGAGLLTLRIFRSLKPIIAAVNGAAVGVGVTLQLAMDIRMAATTARFGMVFAGRGITPEGASAWFLPRLVGLPTALEWCYTARLVGAEEAQRAGLVRSVHEPEDLLTAARGLADEIARSAAPVSVALTRQMLWRLHAAEHPMAAHCIDSRAVQARGQSQDAREGVGAFLEKRPAAFTDRVSKDMPDFYPWWVEPEFE